MRIAINLRLFAPNDMGGIESYIRNIVSGIANHREDGGDDLTIFARDVALATLRELAPRADLRAVGPAGWERSIAPELDPLAHDVLLCPQMGLDPLSPGLPCVAMIPDLAPRIMPECFDRDLVAQREALVSATVRSADIILTLSHHSRRTILAAYGIDGDRVVVTPCDVEPEFRDPAPHEPPAALEALALPDEYVLFPANFWGNKNHDNLLRAVELIVPRRPGFQLVLTGAPATGAERVRAQITALGLGDNVAMIGYQPREVLVALMRRALALVFPTLFEGFGIPPLEAFHLGTPVVASAAAGNAEVVGDAALLVDPNDPRSIADGISRILDDVRLRRELVHRGRARTTQFNWRRSVEAVMDSLRQAAQRERGDARARGGDRFPSVACTSVASVHCP